MPDVAPLSPATARTHQLLEQTGAMKSGHFLLSSGLHSGTYCQCAALFEYPRVAAEMADILVKALPATIEIDVVLAPALGGVLWGYEVARALSAVRNKPIRSYFAERQSGEPFALRRSFVLNSGDRVLLAEDVVTTGGSVMELMPLIDGAGAKAVAFAAVADRSKGKFQPPAPLFSLVKLEFETFDPATCPLCATGSKAVKPGSRAVVPASAKS